MKKKKAVEIVKKQQESKDKIKIKYQNQCQSCHGTFGELKAYGTSRPLNTLSIEELQVSIRDFVLNIKTGSNTFIMRPYADIVNSSDLEALYHYLKSINKN